MPDSESYQAWLAARRGVEPPAHLADTVMARIASDQNRNATVLPPVARRHDVLEWISRRPWLQAACLAAGVAVGALRFLATIQFLLSY